MYCVHGGPCSSKNIVFCSHSNFIKCVYVCVWCVGIRGVIIYISKQGTRRTKDLESCPELHTDCGHHTRSCLDCKALKHNILLSLFGYVGDKRSFFLFFLLLQVSKWTNAENRTLPIRNVWSLLAQSVRNLSCKTSLHIQECYCRSSATWSLSKVHPHG